MRQCFKPGFPGGATGIEPDRLLLIVVIPVAMTRHTEGEKRRQDGEAHIVERVVDRPQKQLDIAAASTRRERCLGRTGGDGKHGALAAKKTAIIAFRPAVKQAVDEDPIEPALENRRLCVPPERKLEDDQVRALDTRDLAANVGGKCALLASMALLGKCREMRRVEAIRIV